MTDYDVLEERNGYRVRLRADEYAEEPYDESQAPLLRIYRSYDIEHIQIGGRPTDDDSQIEEAVRLWGGPSSDEWGKVETYLRAFYGVTTIETYYSDNTWYIAYDSAAWRKYAGWEPGDTLPEELHLMTEWRAYVDGDVYYYVVEKKVHVYQDQRRHAPDGFKAVSTEYDEWEEVDACHGFYGYDYAKEAALEALSSYAPEMKIQ
jgi:hypothetical protein